MPKKIKTKKTQKPTSMPKKQQQEKKNKKTIIMRKKKPPTIPFFSFTFLF